MKNLIPIIKRHWRKGALGAVLILLTSLLAFPGPLITRFLIDKVILGKQLRLLLGVILLLAGIKVAGIVFGILQQYFFTRFEQEVLLDIQQILFDRTLRLPKSFFDDKETGYLMSRLLGDVGGVRWFFSSTIVHIFTSFIRFAGGAVFLLYLNWRLALAVLVVLPLMFVAVRFFGAQAARAEPPRHGAPGRGLPVGAGVAGPDVADQGLRHREADAELPDGQAARLAAGGHGAEHLGLAGQPGHQRRPRPGPA